MERQKSRKFLQIVCPVLIAHFSIFSTILIGDEWDESYENGKAALQRGEWHVADSLFQIALSFRPDPDLQAATSALKLIEYLPHYFLGQAYFLLGAIPLLCKVSKNLLDQVLSVKLSTLLDSSGS